VKVFEPDVENFLIESLLKRLLNVGFVLLYSFECYLDCAVPFLREEENVSLSVV
jgi:hypothetical protein